MNKDKKLSINVSVAKVFLYDLMPLRVQVQELALHVLLMEQLVVLALKLLVQR